MGKKPRRKWIAQDGTEWFTVPPRKRGDDKNAASRSPRPRDGSAVGPAVRGKRRPNAGPQTAAPSPSPKVVATPAKPAAPPSPARLQLDHLQKQITAVEGVIKVATGQHLVHQQDALAAFKADMAKARTDVTASKPPAERKSQLERQLKDVQAKLAANETKVTDAEAGLATLRTYVASQTARVQKLQLEIATLLLPEDPFAADEQRLLKQLEDLRAKRVAAPSPLEPAAPALCDSAPFVDSGGEMQNYVATLEELPDEDGCDVSMRKPGGIKAASTPAVRPRQYVHPKEAVDDSKGLVRKSIAK